MPSLTVLNPFQFDLRRLALGVLYINLGRAAPEFPTTTRAHPSYEVFVGLVPPGDPFKDAYGHAFPMKVRWDIWRNVVEPLFADGSALVKVTASKSSSLRHPNNVIRLSQDPEDLLLTIEKALLDGLVDQGYVPDGSGVTGYVVEDGPLVYKTDAELAAAAAEGDAAVVAEASWADEINNEGDLNEVAATNGWLLKLGLTIPTPDPPPAEPLAVAAETATSVVSPAAEPGEPVVRPGTVELEYEQFDV
jgi:hypothetical protein